MQRQKCGKSRERPAISGRGPPEIEARGLGSLQPEPTSSVSSWPTGILSKMNCQWRAEKREVINEFDPRRHRTRGRGRLFPPDESAGIRKSGGSTTVLLHNAGGNVLKDPFLGPRRACRSAAGHLRSEAELTPVFPTSPEIQMNLWARILSGGSRRNGSRRSNKMCLGSKYPPDVPGERGLLVGGESMLISPLFKTALVPLSMDPSNPDSAGLAGTSRDYTGSPASADPVFWRVEGSLLNLTAVRPVGFFTWNAQSFLERWTRRGTMGLLAVCRPILYATNRMFATRLLHTVLRGESRDRLDLLGEEFFQYFLKPRLKPRGVEMLKQAAAAGGDVVLVSQGLDHIMRPLAKYLGCQRILCNRLDFRDGLATGRLLDPVIRPRGIFAKLRGDQSDGRIPRGRLLRDLAFAKNSAELEEAIRPAERPAPKVVVPTVHFGGRNGIGEFSLREST